MHLARWAQKSRNGQHSQCINFIHVESSKVYGALEQENVKNDKIRGKKQQFSKLNQGRIRKIQGKLLKCTIKCCIFFQIIERNSRPRVGQCSEQVEIIL